jgi:hypothetical protein
MMVDRVTWYGFLRRVNTIESRLLIKHKGATPFRCKQNMERAFRIGKIDAESFDIRMGFWRTLSAHFLSTRPIVDYRDPKDWKQLGDGALRRKTHLQAPDTVNPATEGEQA